MALTDFTQEGPGGNPTIIELQLLGRVTTQHRDLAGKIQPRRIPVYQEGGDAPTGTFLPVSEGHHDAEVRLKSTGNPDLAPVQHPLIIVENRCSEHAAGSAPAPGSEIAIADIVSPRT